MWYLRQTIPTKFCTTFRENGEYYRCHWWMWLGRSFRIQQWVVDPNEGVM
jgi:hypothetical protein